MQGFNRKSQIKMCKEESHEVCFRMALGRSAHFPFCKGEMGAHFMSQPTENPVGPFTELIRNIDSVYKRYPHTETKGEKAAGR